MAGFLQRIPAPSWSLSMLLPLFLSFFRGNVMHSFMLAVAVVIIELWYVSVFELSGKLSEEHYLSVRGRFLFTVFGMIILALLSLCFESLLALNIISAEVFGKADFAFVLLKSVFVVWQLVILVGACTYNLSADEFRVQRVSWYISFLIPPFGVFWVNSQIQKWNK